MGMQPATPPLHVPHEILLAVLSYLPADDEAVWTPPPAPRDQVRHPSYVDPQRTLWAFSLVSRSWHAASVERLYAHPRLSSKNFPLFVATVCPSINPHIRRTDLAGMVRVLDMSGLVYAGTKSMVARLLARLRDGLRVLVASQTSFAVNSLAALSKCESLRRLDLRMVTESIPAQGLFNAVSKLSSLETFYFPRSKMIGPSPSSGSDTGFTEAGVGARPWPPRLRALYIQGGYHHACHPALPPAPWNLELLSIRDFSFQSTVDFVGRCGPNLRVLSVTESRYTQRQNLTLDVYSTMLDGMYVAFPKLQRLAVPDIYDARMLWLASQAESRQGLEELTIGNVMDDYNAGNDYSGTLLDLTDRIVDGVLPSLRRLIVGADGGSLHRRLMEEMEATSDYLQAVERERTAAEAQTLSEQPAFTLVCTRESIIVLDDRPTLYSECR